MSRKTLGILGGMGPEAGAILFKKVLQLTPARTDQEHLEILLHSNSAIPDRTDGILGLGPSAEPELARSVQLLERAGAGCIIIACVTAHHYLESLRAGSQTPILSVVEETVNFMDEHYSGLNSVGLLASTGAVQAGVFQQEFDRRSLNTNVLSEQAQEDLFNEAIYGEYGIKSGRGDKRNCEKMHKAAEILIEQGSEVIVGGCSEIPIVLGEKVANVSVIDTMGVLAAAAVAFCCPDAMVNPGG